MDATSPIQQAAQAVRHHSDGDSSAVESFMARLLEEMSAAFNPSKDVSESSPLFDAVSGYLGENEVRQMLAGMASEETEGNPVHLERWVCRVFPCDIQRKRAYIVGRSLIVTALSQGSSQQGPLLSTLLCFGNMEKNGGFLGFCAQPSSPKTKHLASSSDLEEVRKVWTATKHTGELSCVYTVELARIRESSGFSPVPKIEEISESHPAILGGREYLWPRLTQVRIRTVLGGATVVRMSMF